MYDELVERLRKTEKSLNIAQFDEAENLISQAADAIEELMRQVVSLKKRIDRMKSAASWDEDIRRGQVQGMW